MKKTVSVAQAAIARRPRCRRGCRRRSGELVGAAKEGLLALSVGVGLGVLAELMEEEVDEVVGPKGKHDPERSRGAPRPRGGRGDARRAPRARSSGRACAAPTASSEVRAGDLRSTSPTATRSRGWCSSGCSPASRRAAIERTQRAGRRARSRREARSTSKSAVSREFVARTRENLERADEPPPRRRAPGGADARRDRAEGPHERRRARDHDRRREDPARALGGLDRERDRRDRAALRPRRARPRRRAGRALSCIDGAKALRKASATCFGARARAALHPPQGAQRARPPARARPPGGQAAAAPSVGARRPRPRARAAARCSPASSTARTPAPPPRCAREWRRRSPSPGSASAASLKRTLAVHEPVRVDDRDASAAPAATSSAGSPATWRCAGPPPGCSKPSGSSARSSATATSPSSPSRSSTNFTAMHATELHTATEEAAIAVSV